MQYGPVGQGLTLSAAKIRASGYVGHGDGGAYSGQRRAHSDEGGDRMYIGGGLLVLILIIILLILIF
jgi:hypothetical protein